MPGIPDPSLSAETIDFGASSLRAGADVLVGLTLLAHPDTARVGELSVLFSLAVGGARAVSRVEPDFHAPGASGGKPLTSPMLSRAALWIRLLPSGMLRIENEGGRARVAVNEEPLAGVREFALDALERGVLLELAGCVLLLLHRVAGEPDPEPGAELFGESLEMRRVRAEIRAIADRDDTVLLRGQSGSGKELVARAIQRQSRRHAAPFVTVNVGALPAAMAAALLFGHKRGSFTGATADSPGYFGSADGGTLFLDEMGEVPRDVQPFLLRALGEGEIQPVGEARPRKVDVRVIAATDADLEAKVQAGEFSLALLRRLEGYTIALPPLSRRRDDLARLFFRFLRAELESIGEAHKLAEPEPGRRPWLPLSLLTSLFEHSWPANVAELHNVARRIALGNRQRDQFHLDPLLARNIGHTEPSVQTRPAAPAAIPAPQADLARAARPRRDTASIPDLEIVQAMQENGFNVRAAALALGVSRTWLHNRLPHCAGLRQAKDLTREELQALGNTCAWDVTKMAEALQVSEHGLKLRLAALELH